MWLNTIENLKAKLRDEKYKLICFGGGDYFRKFIAEYPEMATSINLVLDNKVPDGKQRMMVRNSHEIVIYNPNKVKELDMDRFIVLFCSSQYFQMKEQLDALIGREYTSFYFPLFEDYDVNSLKYKMRTLVTPVITELEKYENLDEVLEELSLWDKESLIDKILNEEISTIPRFTVMITAKCSLRCKECENIMWALRKTRSIEKNKIMESIKILCDNLDFIPVIDLIGGEPFISECFDEVLEFCLRQKKIKKIEIVTNGTIVPNKKRIELLKNKKVIVLVSRYENIVDWNPLINCLESEDVAYKKLYPEWHQTGRLDKRNRNEEDIRRQYYNCYSSLMCRTVLEDKMYVCPRAAGMGLLGMINEKCVLNIDGGKNMRNELLDYQMIPNFEVCDYCDGGIEFKKMVPAGEQE